MMKQRLASRIWPIVFSIVLLGCAARMARVEERGVQGSHSRMLIATERSEARTQVEDLSGCVPDQVRVMVEGAVVDCP